MSQIFDALQRSESERSGKDQSAAPRVTDLLQSTENHAASRWDSPGKPEDLAIDGLESVTARPRESFATTAQETAAVVGLLTADERKSNFTQFRSLQVTHPQSRLVCLPDNESAAGEAFHLLGVRLRHLRRGRQLKKVLITSTVPQEGKSMTAANIACTLALRTQEKVLLLEGDIRRPTQSQIFGIDNVPGICDWLRGDQSLAESIYFLQGPGICILPAGNASNNSLELLQSGRLTAMMDQLTTWFDWIIIDSPPVLPLADTSVWTNLSDGILLVTRQGITEKRQLKKGLEAIGTQKMIGALLNSSKTVANSDYYYRPAVASEQTN